MTDPAAARATILEYLEEELDVDPSSIDDRTALFSSGMIDSFSLVDLIVFLQQEFKVKFSAKDVHLDHLDTIEKILKFLRGLQSPEGAGS